jgi:transcriptional regulator with XRE-family HTH domain
MMPDYNVPLVSRSSQRQTPAFRTDRLDAEISSRLLTYEEAAELIGVSVRTLHRWKAGGRGSDPRLKQIRAVAAAFGRDPAYFVEQDPPEGMAA